MQEPARRGRRFCPGRYAEGAHVMTGEEITLAIRRLGMSTREAANWLGVSRWEVEEWELGIEPVPPAVAHELWERIDEQDQEIERLAARLAGVAEPQFENRVGGMEGHTFRWWHNVAREVALRLRRPLIVHVD